MTTGTQRKVSIAHLSASGVALADILANSVAVLLILILLMVNIKQQQAETQLEQTVDVSILMARQLANSVVLDALPNSRPAYLHDYTSCDIPHDCNPNLYPIVQIYDDRIALHNPAISFTRKQLLADNSLFDVYMRRLNNDQRNNMRVDIYGIGMFYLAISALREYGVPLNHWHFLGEKAVAPKSAKANKDGADKLAELLELGAAGLSQQTEGTGNEDKPTQALPEGTTLADTEQFQGLESDSLLPTDISEAAQQSDTPGDQHGQPDAPQQQQSGSMLDELLGEFARRRGEKKAGQAIAENNGKTFRLRIPNFNPPSNAEPINLDLDPDTLEKVLLSFIFAALNDANENLRFAPERLGQLFASIAASPDSFTAPVSPSLIQELQQILRRIPVVSERLITMAFGNKPRINTDPVTLMVSPNSAIEELSLLNADILPEQRELLADSSAAVDLMLRSYPFVYRGERVQIAPNMLVLSLPKTLRSAKKQWRPIAVISPDLQEITLGFAKAGYRDGKLMLPLEVNQIRANGAVLQTSFAVPSERSLWQISASYIITILVAGLLLWLFARWYLRSGTRQQDYR